MSAAPTEGWRAPGKAELWVGVAISCLAMALYASKMATSFASGDTAHYLILANTGYLGDRGNGLPLYVTLLNLAVKLPLPFALSDGIRCNLLTVMTAGASIATSYLGALMLTRNLAAAITAAATLMVSALVWGNAIKIMPHMQLVLIGATFVVCLLLYEESRSRGACTLLGLVCGLGFGLMPNALLLLPPVLLSLFLLGRSRGVWTHLGSAILGFAFGMMLNVMLIVIHELWRPTVSSEHSMFGTVLFFLSGGEESGWFLENAGMLEILRGLLELPSQIAADLDVAGVILACLGLIIGLQTRLRIHLVLASAFGIISIWVGLYPGDTSVSHGLMAYPIVGLWLASGVSAVIAFARRHVRALRRIQDRGVWCNVIGGSVLTLVVLGAIGFAQFTYRGALCSTGKWYFSGFCRERVPDRVGSRYLRRTQAVIDAVPEGALVFGAMWYAADQMNYFIQVRKTRADLGRAYDLTKLSADEFRSKADNSWLQNQRVFVYGVWKDVELWSPLLISQFSAEPRGELLFELFPRGGMAN